MDTVDLQFRSRECKRDDHELCDGYYTFSGSSWGNDTFVCLCDCPGHPLAREVAA